MFNHIKEQGYSVIKAIFLSHLDQDHYNGVIELLREMKKENIEIKNLILSKMAGQGEEKETLEELLELAKEQNVKVIQIEKGDFWRDGKLEFICLAPGKQKFKDSNSNSMVLQLSYGNFHMLLTGDVEKEGEEELIPVLAEEKKQYEVLKVAHHGSASATGEIFLKEVQPKVSLISCGKNNSYGHPAKEVIERLERYGSVVLDTRKTGAITIYPKENGSFRIECFKEGK